MPWKIVRHGRGGPYDLTPPMEDKGKAEWLLGFIRGDPDPMNVDRTRAVSPSYIGGDMENYEIVECDHTGTIKMQVPENV